ncbi:MAG TPA: ABC transporter ATP-binding protein [Casimicrobiaceae bacterium]|nr:ABC transporter ATP-binding protein [Casimicrobiaceae bacterium]
MTSATAALAPGRDVPAAAPGDVFVDVRDVKLDYRTGDGSTLALDRTNMTLRRGEFVAIVGPSGCGKSSLLKLASGLRRPTEGEVVVGGSAVLKPIKIVGMAFQNPTMLPWLRTLDNVLLPLRIVEPHRSQFRAKKAEYERMAQALLAEVGLGSFVDKYPWELSGGMLQRASLCRALIHDPRLLLLDEPFGALDAFTREDLWQVLQKLWMERNPTVILVTHDLREAVFLADTVHVMSARPGRVLVTHRVDIRRPRTLDDLFTEDASRLVHELRSHISHDKVV